MTERHFPRHKGEGFATYERRLARWNALADVIEDRFASVPFCTADLAPYVSFRVTGVMLMSMSLEGYIVAKHPSVGDDGKRRKFGMGSGTIYTLASSRPVNQNQIKKPDTIRMPAPEPVREGIEAQARRWAVYGRSAAVTRICREYGIPYRKAVAIVEAAQ